MRTGYGHSCVTSQHGVVKMPSSRNSPRGVANLVAGTSVLYSYNVHFVSKFYQNLNLSWN